MEMAPGPGFEPGRPCGQRVSNPSPWTRLGDPGFGLEALWRDLKPFPAHVFCVSCLMHEISC